MAKAFLCSLLLAVSVTGTAPAFAGCLPVNGLTFEPEPDCTASTASIPSAPAPVAPPTIAAPAPQVASAPAQENVQPPPAASREITEKSDPRPTLYRVQRNLSDGFLALRSGPGGQYDTVVRIPAGTEGLSVAECPRMSDGSRSWCRVSWKGKTGWVFNRYITQQN
jgi:hypothetical protein